MRDHRHSHFSSAGVFPGRPGFADSFSLHRLWHAWHAIGRHSHGRGGRLSGGGPGFGGFGDEADSFPRGRKFTSDDLQLLLLALIGERPSHGYELIKALDARSNGFTRRARAWCIRRSLISKNSAM
jgi:hypothetical protein